MADKKKFEQTLHLFNCSNVLLLTSKQTSAVVFAVFYGLYSRAITMQPIRQMQWTNTKATSENLIFSFLENNKVQ